MKQYFVFQIVCFICSFYLNNSLQCRVCQKDNRDCLIGNNIEIRTCEDDKSLCFTWFDRKGSEVGIERDCISKDMETYEAMKEIIGEQMSGCIKSINSLDCITFCSLDNCN
ncbi:hypothetical protein I4U23_028757 [Adineta vaga]|nr:hypothetical protein I4U23_028757 [Adineta vaga]